MDSDRGGLVRGQVRADTIMEAVMGIHTPGNHHRIDKRESLLVYCLDDRRCATRLVQLSHPWHIDHWAEQRCRTLTS
ncbi:Uncharacterized protein APZ42_030777 [Daphnia magna]|uniref:Uncharacterized protein n=1 Tax=Daphnia magna TaxID=35525 RepID=A0A164NBA3_9CRUS|nr:Uncharacterized protein APZ42_030777 [Daphnia magna]